MSFYLSPFFRFFLISLFFVLNTFSVSLLSQDINLGESLFKVNCASCHYLGPEEKKLIGPGLDNEIFEEHTEEWLLKWIRNSSELIESGDKVANALYEEYNKAVMTAFPHFSDDDIKNILAYIKEGPAEVAEINSVDNANNTAGDHIFIASDTLQPKIPSLIIDQSNI